MTADAAAAPEAHPTGIVAGVDRCSHYTDWKQHSMPGLQKKEKSECEETET